MKTTLLTIALMAATANITFAEKVLYQSKFDKLKPAEKLFKSNESQERERLFPDTKPALNTSLKPRKKHFNGFLTATGTQTGELKVAPATDVDFPLKRRGELLLPVPGAGKNITIQMSLRAENFFKRKIKNYFFIYISGANIWLRGDNKDIRYYNTAKKRYERIIKLENNKLYNIKVNLHFGEKSLFDLSINGKELLKDEVQRGTSNVLKTIRMVFVTEQKTASTPTPAIYLKNIKVFNN